MRHYRSAAATVFVLAALASAASAQTSDPLKSAVAMTKSADPKTRNDGAQALASLRRPEATAALEGLLASDADERVRQSAATSLGFQGKASSAPALIAALKDASAPVRFAATNSLGALRARAAVGPLSALLSDPDTAMRRAAAAQLGRIGDRSATGALKAALSDSDEGARLVAADALSRLGDVGGLAAALKGLGSKSPLWRRQAADILARSGDASALSVLDAAYAAEKNRGAKKEMGDARTQLRSRLGR